MCRLSGLRLLGRGHIVKLEQYMNNRILQFPFPWADPAAQELHRLLYQLHPTSQQATLIAAKSGIDLSMILQPQAAALLWKDILDHAATAALTGSLILTVRDHLSDQHPNRPFFTDLLENGRVTLTAEPAAPVGKSMFIGRGDEVSEPEALLYYDDLTISTGRIPSLIETLTKLRDLASGVCRMTVDFHGTPSVGTGLRIGTDLLLTNWHVLHHPLTGTQATGVSAEFAYEENPDGKLLAGKPILCDLKSIVASSQDDWAVIRTSEPLDQAWQVIPATMATPVPGQPAYILQHPGGGRKRLGFVRNQISKVTDRFVYYLTDTQPGSSGSPVFDPSGRLIALHRAGGEPQTVVGKPPLKKNEGVHVNRIISGLSKAGILLPS